MFEKKVSRNQIKRRYLALGTTERGQLIDEICSLCISPPQDGAGLQKLPQLYTEFSFMEKPYIRESLLSISPKSSDFLTDMTKVFLEGGGCMN